MKKYRKLDGIITSFLSNHSIDKLHYRTWVEKDDPLIKQIMESANARHVGITISHGRGFIEITKVLYKTSCVGICSMMGDMCIGCGRNTKEIRDGYKCL